MRANRTKHKAHPMRFCVFGAGRMGERHATNVAANARAELVYIVDAVHERARGLAERFNAAAVDDPSVVLCDKSVDAVIISSPTPTHVDLIVASVQAGKAVLCEKPIDLSMARVEACENAIRTSDIPVMIGFQRRFDTTHREVKLAIERGEIGAIETIKIVSRDPQPPEAAYISASGGQFHDQMIHDFDLVLWLSDSVGHIEIFASASNLIDPQIESLGDTDTAQVLMRLHNGALCHIDCSRRSVYGYDQRVEVFGSRGMVCSANLSQSCIERYTATSTAARDRLKSDFMQRYMATYAAELDYFIEAVADGIPVKPDFQSGKRALLLADAARASWKSGQRVTVQIGEGKWSLAERASD